MNHKPIVAPSLLCCDLLNLENEIQALENAGADLLHIDVMDGHFVPNLAFGPDFVRQIKSITPIPIDVHLMVKNPNVVVPWFIDAGASSIAFHPEQEDHPHKLLMSIQDKGVKAGIVLNPGTSPHILEALHPVVDYVLVMSVNPGFSGQSFIASSLDKIRLIRETYAHLDIAIDGGITPDHAEAVIKAGANILISGAFIFHHHPNEGIFNTNSVYKSRIQALKNIFTLH